MKKRKIEFKPKEQIAYIPWHAYGDIKHQDVDFGFVTSIKGDTIYCRYWSKWTPGELRTKSGSEGTPKDMLAHHVSIKQEIVDNLFDELGYFLTDRGHYDR